MVGQKSGPALAGPAAPATTALCIVICNSQLTEFLKAHKVLPILSKFEVWYTLFSLYTCSWQSLHWHGCLVFEYAASWRH